MNFPYQLLTSLAHTPIGSALFRGVSCILGFIGTLTTFAIVIATAIVKPVIIWVLSYILHQFLLKQSPPLQQEPVQSHPQSPDPDSQFHRSSSLLTVSGDGSPASPSAAQSPDAELPVRLQHSFEVLVTHMMRPPPEWEDIRRHRRERMKRIKSQIRQILAMSMNNE